jgi:GNAT superfamily N-acetyltransferase
VDGELGFVSSVPDVPAFRDLLVDYYRSVFPLIHAAGGPDLSPERYADETVAHLGDLLPPDGRLLLGRGPDGRLLACASIRRIRPDAAEMKRMFVRPEARRRGLGRRLVELRIAEARRMGCRAIYADTVKGNRPMLTVYEAFGFRYIPRYPENANPPDFEPWLVYLEYHFPDA